MLKEMDIFSVIGFVVDRTNGVFQEDAKYWQFDRSFVAIPSYGYNFWVYFPGEPYMPFQEAPWFDEGAGAILVSDKQLRKTTLPFSKANKNVVSRNIKLEFNEDFSVVLNVSEKQIGNSAWSLQLLQLDDDSLQLKKYLKEIIEEKYPDAEVDSIIVADSIQRGNTFKVKYILKYANLTQKMGKRVLFNPLQFLRKIEYLFPENNREYPIQFDYAKELHDSLSIILPNGWIVDGLPEKSFLIKKTGLYVVKYEEMENQLRVFRKFKLNKSFWNIDKYENLKKFFKQQSALSQKQIVIKKK
ncbi:MAG: hypothetical protein KAR38_12660, partial [Calditrichia bacterium]|nr:hypothetical protein [Calditrichia bacterium]